MWMIPCIFLYRCIWGVGLGFLSPLTIKGGRMKGRHRSALCLFVVVGICLWSAGSGRGAAPKRGGTLTVVQGVDISHLDVQSAPGYESV